MTTEVCAAVRPTVQVVLEGDTEGWSAYVPSIPGCYAAAKTRQEVTQLIEEALTLHLEDLHQVALQEEATEEATQKG